MVGAPFDTDWTGTTGDWSNSADWSAGVPNSALASATISIVNATIDLSAGETYDISNLTLNAYNAELLVNGALSTNSGIDIAYGTLINAGTLAGPITIQSGGTLVQQVGTTAVLPTTNILDGGSLAFANINGITVNLTNTTSAVFTGTGYVGDEFLQNATAGLTAVSLVTLDNLGTITPTSGTSQTIGGSSYFTNSLDIALDGLINSGLITASNAAIFLSSTNLTNTSTGTLSETNGVLQLGQDFTNSGLISASGGTLELGAGNSSGAWRNQGTITASNALVLIGGTETASDIASLHITQSQIQLDGVLNNSGATLAGQAGNLFGATIADGAIVGGVVDLGAAQLQISNSAFFNDTTLINGGLVVQGDTVGLDNNAVVFQDAGTLLQTITVSDAPGSFGNLGVLDIAAPIGGGTIDQPIDVQSGLASLTGAFTLVSPIIAAGPSAEISLGESFGLAPAWTNQSTISLASGATLAIGGDETWSDIGQIAESSAIVLITGQLQNAGETLSATSSLLGGATLDGGTIVGGAIDNGARNALQTANYLSNTLNDVSILNGLTMTSGGFTLSNGSQVFSDAGTHIGTIMLDGMTSPYPNNPPTLAIIASGSIIDQPLEVLAGDASLSGNFTLTGDLSASGNNAVLSIDQGQILQTVTNSGSVTVSSTTGTFINDAVISISAGATLVIGGDETLADLGTIINQGGVIDLAGTLENTGQTLNAANTLLAGMTLDGGVIEGGVLDAGALNLGYSYTGGTLDHVAIINNLSVSGGTLVLSGGSTVFAAGSGSAPGTITLGTASSSNNYISGELVFAGLAQTSLVNQIVLAGGGIDWQGSTASAAVNVTIGSGQSLVGFGSVGLGYDATTLLNLGTIDATQAYNALTIDPVSLDNRGLITASGSAALDISALAESWSNEGTIATNNAYNVQLNGDFTNAGLINVAGGVLTLGNYGASGANQFINTGTVDALSASVTLYGDETLADLGSLALTNSTLNIAGTIQNQGETLNGTGSSSLLSQAVMAGGTIIGGVIDEAALGLILNNATFENVTLINGLNLSAGRLTLLGDTQIFADAGSTTGTIQVTGTGYSAGNLDILITSPGVVATGLAVTDGAAAISGPFTLTTPVAVSGTLSTLTLDGLIPNTGLQNSWINQTTISVSNGASLLLGGIETAADIGAIANQGGTLYFTDGTLENAGATIGAADTALSGLHLIGGTIEGGAIDVAGLGFMAGSTQYAYSPAPAVLDNVAVLGGLDVANVTLTLSGSTAIYSDLAATAAGSINVGQGGDVAFNTAGTYNLANPIDLSGGNVLWENPLGYNPLAPGNTSTVQVTITTAPVTGFGTIGNNYINNDSIVDLTNSGTIDALPGSYTSDYLHIQGGSFDNRGLVTAAASAGLSIETPSWSNEGTIAGGSLSNIVLGGDFTNAGLITSTGGTVTVGESINSYVNGTYVNSYSSFLNTGSILVNSGEILLDSNINYSDLANIQSQGDVLGMVGGTYDNQGAVLGALATRLQGLTFASGTIEGGTLDQLGLGLSIAAINNGNYYTGGDLDNVLVIDNLTSSTNITLSGSTTIEDATGTNAGSIDLAGGNAYFTGGPDYVLLNQVSMSNGGLNWQNISGVTATPIITIAAGVTVAGSGYIAGYGGSLINDGVISATQPGQYLYIDATTFTNDGTVLCNGGAINISTNDTILSGGLYEVIGGSSYYYQSAIYDYAVTELAATLSLSGSLATVGFANNLASIDQIGTLILSNEASFTDLTTLAVSGDIELQSGAISATALNINAGGSLVGYGTASASVITANGLLEAQGGVLTLAGSVAGTAALSVASFAGLEVAGPTTNNIDLLGSNAAVTLDQAGSLFTGTIENFGGADQILINGFAGATAFFAGNELTISNPTSSITLNVAGSFAPNGLSANVTTLGQTLIELAPSSQALTITAPGTLQADPGIVTSLSGFQITDSLDSNITLQVSDAYGVLAAIAAGSAVVQGSGTDTLSITGNVTDINQVLAGLEYRGPNPGINADTIVVIGAASSGNASALSEVRIDQPASFALPGYALLQPGTAGVLNGVSVVKPDALAGETYSVTLSDPSAVISENGVTGSGTSLVSFTGDLASVNAALAGISLTGTADQILTLSVNDGLGETTTGFLRLDVNNPPTISGSASFVGADGLPVGSLGLSITDNYATDAGQTVSVTLADTLGTLATSGGGATVSGDNSTAITLTGLVGQINAGLNALTYTGPSQGYTSDAVDITVTDASSHSSKGTIHSAPPDPPRLTTPGAIAVGLGIESPVDGVSVQAGANDPSSALITVDLTDTIGTLAVKLSSGVKVKGNKSDNLSLTGTAAALNTALSSLIYTGGKKGGTISSVDDIKITAVQSGASVHSNINVGAPVTNDPNFPLDQPVSLIYGANTAALLQWDQGGSAYVGTLYVDLPGYYPGFESGPPPVQIQFQPYNGNLAGSNGSDIMSTANQVEKYAPLKGSWQSIGMPIDNISPLSLQPVYLTGTDYNAAQTDTTTYIFTSSSSVTGLLPDRRVTVVFNKPGAISIKGPKIKLTTPPTPPTPPTPTPKPTPTPPTPPHHGGGMGDTHLTTFDGLHYDFQGAGEFVLAKSTAPGDSFQIQIRLQPWYNSATVSVMTEIGASVGTHRVTFDANRINAVWVDGQAVSLSANAPYELGAGTLDQLSSTSWQILWDSGEAATITKVDGYLNISTSLPANAQSGSVQGLLGNFNGNPANDLALPNGTVLPQPLSFAQLYTQFADAWRISQSSSLLDYGAGQSTGTFTDLSFPADNVVLSNVPQNIYQNAVSLVTAAGITDPGVAQGAIEDYLLTGDSSFISSAAQNGQSQSSSALLENPVNPNPVTELGIGANSAIMTDNATGTTDVVFTIYATATSASAQIVDYGLADLGNNYISAAYFYSNLPPSGSVTIAAGATSTSLTIAVPTSIGDVAAETLAITISSPSGAAIAAPLAQVELVNAATVAGVAAIPLFEDASRIGSLTGSGTLFTLNLGTFAEGTIPSGLAVDIVNGGSGQANSLYGLLGETGNGVISFAGGLGPIVGLGAGASDQLNFNLDTSNTGAVSEILTFSANQLNDSGFNASLGVYTLAIDATVIEAPDIIAPNYDIVLAGTSSPLGGLSVTAYDTNALAGDVAVTISDQSGLLSVNAGSASVSGENTQYLTIAGNFTAVNDALASLSYSGTRNDIVDVSASLAGLGSVTSAFTVDVSAPITLAGPGALIAAPGAPASLSAISLIDSDALAFNKNFTVTLSDGVGTLSANALDGGAISGAGATITLSGNITAINAELASATYQSALPGTDTITLSASDNVGDKMQGSILVVAPQPGVEITPALTSQTLSANDTTAVVFSIASSQSLSANGTYGFVGDLGGTSIASGTVILTPNSPANGFTIDVVGGLSEYVSDPLSVALVSLGGAGSITLPEAVTTLVNNIPVVGVPALPIIINDSPIGVLSNDGNIYNFDVGVLTKGETISPIILGIGNGAPPGGDLLSASLTSSGDSAIGLTNLPSGFSGLFAAADPTFSVSINTSLAGDFSKSITLTPSQSNESGYSGTLAPVVLNITAEIPCFAAGTAILTESGPVAVEQLQVGDKLVRRAGGLTEIIWIGWRKINILRHKRPAAVRPVLIQAGAISNGVPARDLLLSPDHALALGGHLIPAKALINGVTIRQLAVPSIMYFHIETAQHDVIYAEGTPAETYLDSGNRWHFANGGAAVTLHPDFAARDRAARSCAPVVESGPYVETIRRLILARAQIPLTDDPALKIQRKSGQAIIKSRSAVPGELQPDPRDRRRLGVKIARLAIGGKVIPLDHPHLDQGWHGIEADGRWTDGRAIIPAALMAGSTDIEIELAGTTVYRQ